MRFLQKLLAKHKMLGEELMKDKGSDFWGGKKCLVTGGYGFGGSHLCEQLLEKGARVYVLDRETPSNSYLALAGLTNRIHYLYGHFMAQPLSMSLLPKITPHL